MIYHKFKLNDEIEMKVELCESQLMANCGECRTEIALTTEEISEIWKDGEDSASTTFFCTECSKRFGVK